MDIKCRIAKTALTAFRTSAYTPEIKRYCSPKVPRELRLCNLCWKRGWTKLGMNFTCSWNVIYLMIEGTDVVHGVIVSRMLSIFIADTFYIRYCYGNRKPQKCTVAVCVPAPIFSASLMRRCQESLFLYSKKPVLLCRVLCLLSCEQYNIGGLHVLSICIFVPSSLT